jgi:hypothetical protein
MQISISARPQPSTYAEQQRQRILPRMNRLRRRGRPLALAGTVTVVLLALGLLAWPGARSMRSVLFNASTRVVDRTDPRFDVLVQHRPEALGDANERLTRPDGQPQLTAAQAFSIAHGERQPHGDKPSVRLATFTDPDFPTPVGPDHKLVSRAKRALVWVVVMPDVPSVEFGPEFGPDFGPQSGPQGPQHVCPTYTPVDATTGEPLGIWQHC